MKGNVIVTLEIDCEETVATLKAKKFWQSVMDATSLSSLFGGGCIVVQAQANRVKPPRRRAKRGKGK